jgi:hypothetical protein
MGMDFIISMSCLVSAIILGLSLTVQNYKRLIETHDDRMEAYRRRKKAKNEALRQYLGLPEVREARPERRPEPDDELRC